MMLVSLAASPLMVNPIPPALISMMFGLAVFLFAWTIWRTLATDDLTQESEWRYDVNRINELRRVSPFFRTLQPLVQAFARFNRGAFVEQLPEIGREIQAAGLARFWTAEEYLARIEIQALMLLPLYVYASTQMMGPAGIVMAIMFTILTGYLLRRRLRNMARYRLVLIKRRMPFLLDLVTLLMEAGSTFLQALKEGVDEFREHPVGVEFGRVLGELNMGKGRTAALESMRDRLHDDEITGIVGAIIQGEQLGTPLARIFRTQADVLRLKRSQRAETLAGEAAVKMLLPGILIMASTVLVILGPFMLSMATTDIMN
ncbi:MAG: type II secretion system F family protein [Planctomycetales bacterium]|nr:type II secretion system F family protein [Planctomycetales bacterium]